MSFFRDANQNATSPSLQKYGFLAFRSENGSKMHDVHSKVNKGHMESDDVASSGILEDGQLDWIAPGAHALGQHHCLLKPSPT